MKRTGIQWGTCAELPTKPRISKPQLCTVVISEATVILSQTLGEPTSCKGNAGIKLVNDPIRLMA